MAKRGKSKSRAPPSPAQLANRQRFAAMMSNRRGAVGGAPRKHSTGGMFKEAFHKISWGVAALSALAGYYLPSTLSNLGVGQILYQRVPGYRGIVDTAWNASGQNPAWANGGLVGWGKIGGGGYIAKKIYDLQNGKKASQGEMSVGIPFALGLLLDTPTVNPAIPGSFSGSTAVGGGAMGAQLSQGGVTW